MFRDVDPPTGRYVEADPAGQLLYFTFSLVRRSSSPARAGYWNQLYAYVDDAPTQHVDKLGLGWFDWLLDFWNDKAPETVLPKTAGGVLALDCIVQNCKRRATDRDSIQLLGDCISILHKFEQARGSAAVGAMQPGFGIDAIVSDCAELCAAGLKKAAEAGSCCGK